MITYQVENDLGLQEFKALLIESTLGERRPVDEDHRLEKMLANGNLIVTARDGNCLVGVSRSLTDFGYCTYLSDLAVAVTYQRRGIGKRLIKETKLAAPMTTVILLAAPTARKYYGKIGMTQFEYCFLLTEISAIV